MGQSSAGSARRGCCSRPRRSWPRTRRRLLNASPSTCAAASAGARATGRSSTPSWRAPRRRRRRDDRPSWRLENRGPVGAPHGRAREGHRTRPVSQRYGAAGHGARAPAALAVRARASATRGRRRGARGAGRVCRPGRVRPHVLRPVLRARAARPALAGPRGRPLRGAAGDGGRGGGGLARGGGEYEELPGLTTLEEALAPGASLVHTGEPLAGHFSDLSSPRAKPGTNICHQFDYPRGDVAAALAGAHLVLKDTYTFPRVQHYSMEP